MTPIRFWSDTDAKGVTAKCEYDEPKGLYTVVVSKIGADGKVIERKETFPRTYEPYFGMDVADVATSQQIAEKLGEEVDKL